MEKKIGRPRKYTESKRISIFTSQLLYEKLEKKSKELSVSISQLVSMCVDDVFFNLLHPEIEELVNKYPQCK